jgi:hypothetical protein
VSNPLKIDCFAYTVPQKGTSCTSHDKVISPVSLSSSWPTFRAQYRYRSCFNIHTLLIYYRDRYAWVGLVWTESPGVCSWEVGYGVRTSCVWCTCMEQTLVRNISSVGSPLLLPSSLVPVVDGPEPWAHSMSYSAIMASTMLTVKNPWDVATFLV